MKKWGTFECAESDRKSESAGHFLSNDLLEACELARAGNDILHPHTTADTWIKRSIFPGVECKNVLDQSIFLSSPHLSNLIQPSVTSCVNFLDEYVKLL